MTNLDKNTIEHVIEMVGEMYKKTEVTNSDGDRDYNQAPTDLKQKLQAKLDEYEQ